MITDLFYSNTLVTRSHVIEPYVFTNENFSRVDEICRGYTQQLATGYEGRVLEFDALEYRNNRRAVITYGPETGWLFDELRRITVHINQQYFGYELTGFHECRYTVYDKPGQHYAFHQEQLVDTFDDTELLHRKLHLRLILSEPMGYVGADLQVAVDSQETPITIIQKKASVIAIPGFIQQRVTELESGEYRYLEWTVLGPKFK